MIDLDLKSYSDLYLKNAQEELRLIRSLISRDVVDIKTIHRICHSLKGQSFFMGFNDIGLKALELEIYYRQLLENNQDQSKKTNVEEILSEIERLLINKINVK
ncbi:MAG: Hpt domain-containing protein [Patescibacteria group bacterium]|jgi:chemotaxis protein histidine kinase CheA